jgi:hypothetical protein
MALASGGRLGPYQILSPVGAGGQGEVYRENIAAVLLPPRSFLERLSRI